MKFKKGQTPWNKGKKGIYSEETRRKMSESRKGKPSWNKGGKNPKMSGENHPMFGKHLPEETRRKISEAKKGSPSPRKGVKVSEETRRKQSFSQLKRFSKTEEIKKISKAQVLVYINNPELRKRRSEIAKRRFENQDVWNKGKTLSKEHKINLTKGQVNRYLNPKEVEKARKNMIKQLKAGAIKNTDTKIERAIKEGLIKRGYKEGEDFICQFNFMNKFLCDFCFPNYKVIVEAQGDYWHCNPSIYPQPINEHQIHGIERDNKKRAFIPKVENGSWILLEIWEKDIKKNIVKCIDMIEESLLKKQSGN